MNIPFQEILQFIPLHELTFVTPLPKELVYYNEVSKQLSARQLRTPTLFIINSHREFNKLNNIEVANQIIQDPNLVGIVICLEGSQQLKESIITLYKECQVPIISLSNESLGTIFEQRIENIFTYGQLSKEVAGVTEVGLEKVAERLSIGLQTPLFYLDNNYELVWSIGEEDDFKRLNRWLNINFKQISKYNYANVHLNNNKQFPEKLIDDTFSLFAINIEAKTHTLIATNTLENWQKKLIDKLAGLLALIFQIESKFKEQQLKIKEHFIYDLLYYKFESKDLMIKHGKFWGWNLENPHYLIIVNVNSCCNEELTENDLVSIASFIQTQHIKEISNIHAFVFQGEIIILIEETRIVNEINCKNEIRRISRELIKKLYGEWPNFNFSMGIGNSCKDATNLNISYEEAKIALKYGEKWFKNKNVYHIKDLGIFRLLQQIPNNILNDFRDDYLHQLITSDNNNGTEYLKTLQTYIQCDGVINEVSERLFVHPNTLRNRLKKIEELTGVDIQSYEKFINLIIASKLQSLN